MKEESIEEMVYRYMCADCPSARRCHESCETCEEYEDEIQRLEEENK